MALSICNKQCSYGRVYEVFLSRQCKTTGEQLELSTMQRTWLDSLLQNTAGDGLPVTWHRMETRCPTPTTLSCGVTTNDGWAADRHYTDSDTLHWQWHVTLTVTHYTDSDTLHWPWHITLTMTRYTDSDTLHWQWHVTLIMTCYTDSDTHWPWHVTLTVTCYTDHDMLH